MPREADPRRERMASSAGWRAITSRSDQQAFEDDVDATSDSQEVLELLRIADRLAESGGNEPESEPFLQEFASELAKATSSRKTVVSLVDPSTDTLELRASHGFGADPPRELGYVQDGIHGWVRKIGTTMVVSDPEQHHGLPLLPFENVALIASPIQVGDTTLGVVSVLEPMTGGSHREEDMLFVNTVASLVGGMIGHKRAEQQGHEAVRKAIESLTMALDARDPYTRGHSQRVAMYSLAIANELELGGKHKFPKNMRNSLLMSALLHDIGKIGIRDEVLLKPGKLTDDEYALIKTHPEKGAEIVRMIPGFDDNVIAGILQHHERMDGKGYPGGIVGEKIHIFGRIIGLADAFDAIVTSRPYSHGSSFTFALTRIEELAGTSFDPDVVRAMLAALKDQAAWNELGSISQTRPESEAQVAPSASDGETPDRKLRRIFGRNINELPTLPHVVSQILEKTRDQDASLTEVVSIISTDQALVSTLLKLVNSAFYGFSRRITTLKQAITLLGFRSVRNVVVNCGVVGIFRKRTFNNHYRFRLWDHSVACAVAARTLAEMKGFKAKEEAFTAGLLHDIGKVVIDQYAPKDSAAIMRKVEAGADPREAETEVLGVDHTQVGGWIAERWHLPKTLCWVIEYHHAPDSPDLPGGHDLVKLIATANSLASIKRTDDRTALAASIEEFAAGPANLLGLSPHEAAQALAETWRQKNDAMKMFGPGVASRTAESAEPEADGAAPVPSPASPEGRA
ncbi:MAG: HDOD domain-containing protein [bacterium]